MLSKNLAKHIKSLQLKKYRKEEQKFLVEGAKSVLELLNTNFKIHAIISTEAFWQANKSKLQASKVEIIIAKEIELSTIGSLQNNDSALAVVEMQENTPLQLDNHELALALDDIRDPGNLGTIIRIADWYGIDKIICSENTTELYNPKVIIASMGSFTRVKLYYTDLSEYLSSIKTPIYGAFLEGEDIHRLKSAPQGGVIVLGNESNGIGQKVGSLVSKKISIPGFGRAESLNVAIATAVICDNFRRLSI